MINRNSYQLTTTSSLLQARLAAVISAVCVGRSQHGTMLFKQPLRLSDLTCWVKGQDVKLRREGRERTDGRSKIRIGCATRLRGHEVCCSDESF